MKTQGTEGRGATQKRIRRERQERAKGGKSELPGQRRQRPATAQERPPPTRETGQEQTESETQKRDCADSKLRGGGRARPGQPERQEQSQDVRPGGPERARRALTLALATAVPYTIGRLQNSCPGNLRLFSAHHGTFQMNRK